MRNVLLLAIPAIVVLAPNASATLLDDFGDGDDVGWIRDDQLLSSGGPGNFDASSGSYVLSSTSTVSNDYDAVVAYWQDSAASSAFSDGRLKARVRMSNDSSNVSLAMRADGGNTAYAFSANNNLDTLLISAILGGGEVILASVPFAITEGKDYWLSAEAVGPNLSLNFWEAGTPEPLAPLLSASDSYLASGQIGLVAYYWGSPVGSALSATFDDVQFVPEPSTGLLLCVGLASLAARRLRHSGQMRR